MRSIMYANQKLTQPYHNFQLQRGILREGELKFIPLLVFDYGNYVIVQHAVLTTLNYKQQKIIDQTVLIAARKREYKIKPTRNGEYEIIRRPWQQNPPIEGFGP